MRVAFVTVGLEIGGTATYTLFLSAALRRMGVPVEVFSFSGGHPLSREFAEAEVPVLNQDNAKLIYEDRLQNIYAGLRKFQPTAVFAVLGAEAFETLRYLPRGVARIGILHDRATHAELTLARYRGTMDHLVVVAPYLREEIRNIDPDIPCTYLAHGIPIPKDIAPRDANPTEPLRLLYYGRFENDSKGVRLFPDIAAALHRRQVPFTWTLHGSGPEEEFLRNAFAKEMKNGQVRFSTPVPYPELPVLVRRHDVYMLASTNEGGPLTLLESMALGLVPVCGDIQCLVREVITHENGFRVRRDDPDAYAQAIEQLHRDRALLEKLSAASRSTITEHFSAEAMARRYTRFLESLPGAGNSEWPVRIRPRPILGLGGLATISQSLGIFRHARRYFRKLKARR